MNSEAEESTPPGSSTAERIRGALRFALGSATLLMLALSWPLWVPLHTKAFPRVPFLPALTAIPNQASHVAFCALLGAIGAATIGVAWRRTLALAGGLLLVLILWDQHRFQPWVYQFLMIGLLLVSLPSTLALRYTRWWFVSLYFYSALSKLDVSFCQKLGNLFLTTALSPLGLDPAGWPTTWRVAAILTMPVGELAVAVALLIPRTRRLGLAAALVLHTALLGILGPWGLGHSTIVLVWNAAMMAEVAILFGPREPTTSPANTSSENAGWLGVLARLVFWAGVVLPLGERWGWLDTWPSHALYASHAERTDVFVLGEQADELSPELRAHLGPVGFDGWRRLDLTAWSRAVRGVPVYPQGRACNGLAEAIAARYRGHLLIKVVQWSRAELWTGRRARVECLGGEAIRRYGDRFSVNAHPARSSPEQRSAHRDIAPNRPPAT